MVSGLPGAKSLNEQNALCPGPLRLPGIRDPCTGVAVTKSDGYRRVIAVLSASASIDRPDKVGPAASKPAAAAAGLGVASPPPARMSKAHGWTSSLRLPKCRTLKSEMPATASPSSDWIELAEQGGGQVGKKSLSSLGPFKSRQKSVGPSGPLGAADLNAQGA